MKNNKKKFESIQNLICQTGYFSGLAACFFSICLTALFISKLAPSWYSKLPIYSQLIVGDSTWMGYSKAADMNIVKTFLGGILICFFPLYFLFAYLKKCASELKAPIDYVIAAMMTVTLIAAFAGSKNAWQYAGLVSGFILGVLILERGHLKSRIDEIMRLIRITVILYAQVVSFLLLVNAFLIKTPDLWNNYGMIAFWLISVIFPMVCLFKKYFLKAGWIEKLQWIIPLGFVGMYRFRYLYKGEVFTLFYSGKWKWFCVLMALLGIGFSVLYGRNNQNNETNPKSRKITKNRNTQKNGIVQNNRAYLYPSTYIFIAVSGIFSMPSAVMSIDYFHNGEITMPMQQLLSFHKMPYWDIIPIHGMGDYYYALINHLFLDGTYISLSAATLIGNILAALFITLLCLYFVEGDLHKLVFAGMLIPYVTSQAGMRYFALFVMLMVLLSDKVRLNPMKYIWAWIFLSMLAITWNASIGGAAALAFFIPVIYRIIFKMPGQLYQRFIELKNDKKAGWLIAWVCLFILGICYIPLFLKIVEYLRDNTGTTLYVNGMKMLDDTKDIAKALVPAIINENGLFFFRTFGFLFALLLCLWILVAMKDKASKKRAMEYMVVFAVAGFVLINYAFVRFDEGLRAEVMTILFISFTAVYLIGYKLRENQLMQIIYVLSFLPIVLFVDRAPVFSPQNVTFIAEIPDSIETTIMGKLVDDPVVYVTGDSVGMPNLGNGFVEGNYISSLQNEKTLTDEVKAKSLSYVNFTNTPATDVILNMENPLPYTSVYNISNDCMQKKAIQMLSNHLPDVILLAPGIEFDDAPLSFRSPLLFKYLMNQDYKPYKYQNVIFLSRSGCVLSDAQYDEEALASVMYKKDLGYLPAIWAKAVQGEGVDTAKQKNIAYHIQMSEDGFDIVFDEKIKGEELDFLLLHMYGEDAYDLINSNSNTAKEMTEINTSNSNDDRKWDEDIQEQSDAKNESYSSIKACIETSMDTTAETDDGFTSELLLKGENDYSEYTFAYALGDYLIPLYANTYWRKGNIEKIHISSDCLANGYDVKNLSAYGYTITN